MTRRKMTIGSVACVLTIILAVVARPTRAHAFDIISSDGDSVAAEVLLHNATFSGELLEGLTNIGVSHDAYCLQVIKTAGENSWYNLRLFDQTCAKNSRGEVVLGQPSAAVANLRVMQENLKIKAYGKFMWNAIFMSIELENPYAYPMTDDLEKTPRRWMWENTKDNLNPTVHPLANNVDPTVYWYALTSGGEYGIASRYVDGNGKVITKFPDSFDDKAYREPKLTYYFVEDVKRAPSSWGSQSYKAGIWYETSKGYQRVGDIKDGVISSLCTGKYSTKCNLVVEHGTLVGVTSRVTNTK